MSQKAPPVVRFPNRRGELHRRLMASPAMVKGRGHERIDLHDRWVDVMTTPPLLSTRNCRRACLMSNLLAGFAILAQQV